MRRHGRTSSSYIKGNIDVWSSEECDGACSTAPGGSCFFVRHARRHVCCSPPQQRMRCHVFMARPSRSGAAAQLSVGVEAPARTSSRVARSAAAQRQQQRSSSPRRKSWISGTCSATGGRRHVCRRTLLQRRPRAVEGAGARARPPRATDHRTGRRRVVLSGRGVVISTAAAWNFYVSVAATRPTTCPTLQGRRLGDDALTDGYTGRPSAAFTMTRRSARPSLERARFTHRPRRERLSKLRHRAPRGVLGLVRVTHGARGITRARLLASPSRRSRTSACRCFARRRGAHASACNRPAPRCSETHAGTVAPSQLAGASSGRTMSPRRRTVLSAPPRELLLMTRAVAQRRR